MRIGDLRSRRSPKFVTAIEWRPVRWCLRTVFVSMGKEENGESSTRKAGVLREIGADLHGERGVLGFSWGPRETCTRSRLISSAPSSERWRDAKPSKAHDTACVRERAADGHTRARARARTEEANEVRRSRRRARRWTVRGDHDRADRASHDATTPARQPQLGVDVAERERSGAAPWRRLAVDVQ